MIPETPREAQRFSRHRYYRSATMLFDLLVQFRDSLSYSLPDNLQVYTKVFVGDNVPQSHYSLPVYFLILLLQFLGDMFAEASPITSRFLITASMVRSSVLNFL